jgi:hypothetical protein
MNNIFCQYCGTSNSADARYCKSCGREMPVNVQSHPSQQQPQSYPTIFPQEQAVPHASQPTVYAQPVQPYPQQVNIPLQPATIAPPPKKKKGRVILILLLLAVIGCCGAVWAYNQLLLRPIQKTGDDFLKAMQQQNYASAYIMMAADVQSQLGSTAGLQSFMEANKLAFTSYTTSNLQRIEGNPTQGILMADLTLLDGTKYTMEVDMQVGPGNVWQVIGFGPPAK